MAETSGAQRRCKALAEQLEPVSAFQDFGEMGTLLPAATGEQSWTVNRQPLVGGVLWTWFRWAWRKGKPAG